MIDNKGAAHRNIDANLLDILNRVGISETNGTGIDKGNVFGNSDESVFYTSGVLVYLQENRKKENNRSMKNNLRE
jgi:hypothetical protein